MQRTIFVLALALGLVAAPAWAGALTADPCPPCCPQAAEAPCETGGTPCVSLSAVSCCAAAPAVPSSETKSRIDAPSLQPVAAAHAGAPVPRCAVAPPAPTDLALRTSPLRLSVVLLI